MESLARTLYFVLCAYLTSPSLICCELFKGGDTEMTDSFQNVAQVRLCRHQTQNWGPEALEPALSKTCCQWVAEPQFLHR